METAVLKLDTLNEAKYNPRKELKPGDTTYEKLKKSIEQLGFVEPIVVNKRNMVIVGGHQRLHVLRDMGIKETTVVLVDCNDTQEKQLNLSLNKIKGDWSYTKLKEVMLELEKHDGLLDLTGFDEFEIKTMFTDYSNIDDLIENDFSEVDNNEKVKLTFDMSFGLPEELKEKALEYTNKNGKGVLAQAVLDFVEGN